MKEISNLRMKRESLLLVTVFIPNECPSCGHNIVSVWCGWQCEWCGSAQYGSERKELYRICA